MVKLISRNNQTKGNVMPKTLKEACEMSIEKWEKINRNLEQDDIDDIDDDDFYEVTQSCGLCLFDLAKMSKRCTECPLWKKGLRCYEVEPYKSIYKRVDRLNHDGSLGADSFLDDEERMERLREDVIHYGEILIEKLSEIVTEIEGKE